MEYIRGLEEIDDPSYRYKMPKMTFQKERTKTRITNLDKIADTLKVPQSLIVSFIKKRLSINITSKKDGIIVSNDVDISAVQNALYEFIEHFVICKSCKFPELQYFQYSKKEIATMCDSCGHSTLLTSNDNTKSGIKSMASSKNYPKADFNVKKKKSKSK